LKGKKFLESRQENGPAAEKRRQKTGHEFSQTFASYALE